MQVVIDVPDSFYQLSLKEQEQIIRQALEEQKISRQWLLNALRKSPDAKVDMSEEEQLAMVDNVRQEIYEGKE
jgi:hypothetical protein